MYRRKWIFLIVFIFASTVFIVYLPEAFSAPGLGKSNASRQNGVIGSVIDPDDPGAGGESEVSRKSEIEGFDGQPSSGDGNTVFGSDDLGREARQYQMILTAEQLGMINPEYIEFMTELLAGNTGGSDEEGNINGRSVDPGGLVLEGTSYALDDFDLNGDEVVDVLDLNVAADVQGLKGNGFFGGVKGPGHGGVTGSGGDVPDQDLTNFPSDQENLGPEKQDISRIFDKVQELNDKGKLADFLKRLEDGALDDKAINVDMESSMGNPYLKELVDSLLEDEVVRVDEVPYVKLAVLFEAIDELLNKGEIVISEKDMAELEKRIAEVTAGIDNMVIVMRELFQLFGGNVGALINELDLTLGAESMQSLAKVVNFLIRISKGKVLAELEIIFKDLHKDIIDNLELAKVINKEYGEFRDKYLMGLSAKDRSVYENMEDPEKLILSVNMFMDKVKNGDLRIQDDAKQEIIANYNKLLSSVEPKVRRYAKDLEKMKIVCDYLNKLLVDDSDKTKLQMDRSENGDNIKLFMSLKAKEVVD